MHRHCLNNIQYHPLGSHVCPLIWFSTTSLSQPSSPDKKEPLLRCFMRHYETVAMDTPSEQAPHTCSRISNGRSSISHLGKEFAGALLSVQGIKNAVAQAPEVCTTAGFGHWRDHLLLASEVGYVVFSASFGHSCSSLKWWPILSSTTDQRSFSLASHKACVSQALKFCPDCATALLWPWS